MDSDSHSERRNLSVLSFAIIVYFLAGGSIDLATVRLGIFNATFERAYILEAAVWVALLWFMIRFWLTTKGIFYREVLPDHLNHAREGILVRAYVWSCFNGLEPIKPGKVFTAEDVNKIFVRIGQIKVNKDSGRANNDHFIEFICQKLVGFKDGNQPSLETIPVNKIQQIKSSGGGNRLRITGLSGCILITGITLKNVFEDASFSQLIMPYVLFATAIVCGLHAFLTC